MKVAHYGNFSPHSAGMCHTVMDMVLAERLVGIDSQFIDWKGPQQYNQQLSRVGLTYRGVETASPLWAERADLLVLHSGMPTEARVSGKPIIVTMHGRPEYTFELERREKGGALALTLYRECSKEEQFVCGITFWNEHLSTWKALYPDFQIKYVPAMVDLSHFRPDGQKYNFKNKALYGPNIVIADVWREDRTPFNVLFAAVEFVKKHGGKIQVFGLSEPNKTPAYANIFNPLIEQGFVGGCHGLVGNIDQVYRAADFVVTPHNIATRVVREALASGCPIVAGAGNQYTSYQANPNNIPAFTKQIEQCWSNIQKHRDPIRNNCRTVAETQFNLKQAGETAKKIYSDVLAVKRTFPPKMKGDIFTFIPYAPDGDLGSAYNGHIQAVNDDDWACFIDQDAMFTTPDWNKQMRQIIAEHPDYGCFSVMTNRIGNPEQAVPDLEDTHDILYHRKIGSELWERNGTKVMDVTQTHAISGVVILVSRRAWERAGGFAPGWMGVDNDFHIRLVNAGIKVGLAKGLYVYHVYRADNQGRRQLSHPVPSFTVAPQIKEK